MPHRRSGARTLALIAEELARVNAGLRKTVAERTADLESFSYSVSHNLCTPLRAVEGFSRIAMEEYWDKLDDAGKRLLQIVRDNPAMLHQVLTNLIGNTVKFTKNKDHAVIGISGRTCDDDNVYCVRDNGAGFDMQFSGKLSGVFQRLHGTGELDGTGIGLAIVKRIVSRHSGRVWAEGKPDEGAMFYFALPATNEEDGHA